MIYLRKKCFLSNARFPINLGKEGMVVYDWNFTWNVVSNWMMINQKSNVSCNKLLNFWNAKNTYIWIKVLKIVFQYYRYQFFLKYILARDVYLFIFSSIFDVNYMILDLHGRKGEIYIYALIEKLHKNDMLHHLCVEMLLYSTHISAFLALGGIMLGKFR